MGLQMVRLWQDESEPSTPGTSIASRTSGDSTDISSLVFHSKQAPSKLTAKSRLKAKNNIMSIKATNLKNTSNKIKE